MNSGAKTCYTEYANLQRSFDSSQRTGSRGIGVKEGGGVCEAVKSFDSRNDRTTGKN
jgi:hypothetical protein